ncbi:biotin--[acetyl-CoA-carboxylase] ligase [Massilibacteroides sp.]|uniref:biotin--[acetyl-CoA-carboxylase] ligase n=1 Tax=Massilibacteroides sp. TaxID=2034766 RepID=UPI00262B2079|nr:biotin--[acetyl-CoA-carboxylase] ligase [Massilibacteroides sp.]MDD4516188.1 biotin--[acetyl-CoA-carboxylase] ligase [Massilibacteroides sp.]
MQNSSFEDSPEVIYLEETDSTNSQLRRILSEKELAEGSLVVSMSQTAGRGQTGNKWESEAGKNLTFSMVIYPETVAANEQFLISQVCALSVKRTLATFTDNIWVKWPNDIYWNDRKICGMLIENDLAGKTIHCSICGIGININQKRFFSDAPNPVSLTQITGEEYNLGEMLHLFQQHFYALYLQLLQEKKEEIRKEYKDVLYRGKGFHSYSDKDGSFEARIKEIMPTGHLVLELANGETRCYAFKEVAIK